MINTVVNYILLGLGIVFMVSIPLAIFAMRLREGFWSNTICFCNVSFASLIAFNYFEPVASLIADAWIAGLFFFDYLAFWLLFAFSYFFINAITNRLSTIKVHFAPTVEKAGNGTMLCAIFVNFLFVILFTLPAFPLQPSEDEMLSQISNGTELLGRRARILSEGSLSALDGEKPWVDAATYTGTQTGKRWALYQAVLEKKSFLFEGEKPPQR